MAFLQQVDWYQGVQNLLPNIIKLGKHAYFKASKTYLRVNK